MYRKNGLCVPKGKAWTPSMCGALIVNEYRTRKSLHPCKYVTSAE